MTTAAQILDYCQTKQADIYFDKHGVIRVLQGPDLQRMMNAAKLSEVIGSAPVVGIGSGVVLDAPGYGSLADVLLRAFQQASAGKGKERHANSLPFDQQPMQSLARAHGIGFLTGQACKKTEEALGLPAGRDIAELLGAINYLAGAVIFLERSRQASNDNYDSLMSDLDRYAATQKNG